MQSSANQKRACIPSAWYTSAQAYLPDPLSDVSEGLVPRLGYSQCRVRQTTNLDS